MRQIFLIFVELFSFAFTLLAQPRLDTLGWRSPVDIPIYLAGNFAELRADHFHGGIDIKTQGKEGFKLYAVKDGYISRIKITPGGYGKAIYVTHPDGYTSVYGHMQDYNIQIDRYVKQAQYKQKNYSVDLFPDKDELVVKKGDVLGLSGNTGGSGGPHLHFEIRETSTSRPLNGLLLGYDIDDTIAPKMFFLYAYPQNYQSAVNGSRTHKVFSLNNAGTRYKIKNSDTLLINGEVGFGLKVSEFLNNSANRCGVYELDLWVDGELYMQQVYDKFSFAESRYINSLMDYEASEELNRKLYKLYRDPNSQLSIYKKDIDRGLVSGEPGQVKKVLIEAKDVKGNTSKLEFYLRFKNKINRELPEYDKIIAWQNDFTLDTAGFKMEMSAKSLYDTLFMTFAIDKQRLPGTFSDSYILHNRTVPVHKSFDISVPCDQIDSSLYNKVMLARVVNKNFIPAGGYYVNGKVEGKVSNLGKYVVVVDTTAPKITPLDGLSAKHDLTTVSELRFKIDDNFSGIKDYKATINGNWVLFEWDPKNRLITYKKDEYMPKDGLCDFELVVTDNRGNQSVFKKEFEVYQVLDNELGQ